MKNALIEVSFAYESILDPKKWARWKLKINFFFRKSNHWMKLSFSSIHFSLHDCCQADFSPVKKKLVCLFCYTAFPKDTKPLKKTLFNKNYFRPLTVWTIEISFNVFFFLFNYYHYLNQIKKTISVMPKQSERTRKKWQWNENQKWFEFNKFRRG